MLTALAQTAPWVRTWRYWGRQSFWGDQGSTSQCVAYAWTAWLEDGPVLQPGKPSPTFMAELYAECQRSDEWEGQDYDGTSVRAGAKVLQSRGLIESYLWGTDLDTVVDTVLTLGPVVMGTNWTEAMFTPDAQGVIRYRGSVVGGHAWKVDGVNRRTGMARAKQSWGRDWGLRGGFWVPFEDLERLIVEDGEACLAIERRAA